jgi:hypothetical protein
MSTMSVRLPESLHEKARELARRDPVALTNYQIVLTWYCAGA